MFYKTLDWTQHSFAMHHLTSVKDIQFSSQKTAAKPTACLPPPPNTSLHATPQLFFSSWLYLNSMIWLKNVKPSTCQCFPPDYWGRLTLAPFILAIINSSLTPPLSIRTGLHQYRKICVRDTTCFKHIVTKVQVWKKMLTLGYDAFPGQLCFI